MSQNQWHLIGRGLNGWHAAGINVTSSGGQLEPYTYWTGQECDGYAREAVDGAFVYDASEADPSIFARVVISGPMLHPELFSGWRKFGQDDFYPHSFDYVGPEIFERIYRMIPGMKFGHVQNGVCVWE